MAQFQILGAQGKTCVSVFRQARRRGVRPIGVGHCVPLPNACFADKDFKRIRTLRRFSKTTLPSWRYRMRSSLRLWRYDAFAFGSKGATFEALSGTPIASTPNNSAIRFRRLATSPEMA